MITTIHVSQANLRLNKMTGDRNPVITVDRDGETEYGFEAIILDKDGTEAARVVYRPHAPLMTGVHCWVETTNGVIVE